ncbi:uncharacterized protein LOC111109938 [Crassostrea virginica]
MAVSSCTLFLCIVAITFRICTTAGCYFNTYYRTSYCSYNSYYDGDSDSGASIGTIIGAIIGGIVGLIVLGVITAYVKNICCKKKISPETSIHPAEVSIVNSNSAASNDYSVYPHLERQGWGLQPGSFYSGHQQLNPPPPVSQPLPPLRSTQ